MAFNLIVRPEVEQDLSEAFRWYEERRKGLCHEFLLQVEAVFRFLERTPLVYPEIYRGILRHLIKRFPYKIFHLVEQETVAILAVLYGGRDPQWIKKRLE